MKLGCTFVPSRLARPIFPAFGSAQYTCAPSMATPQASLAPMKPGSTLVPSRSARPILAALESDQYTCAAVDRHPVRARGAGDEALVGPGAVEVGPPDRPGPEVGPVDVRR